MAKTSIELRSLDVNALLALRSQIDDQLQVRRRDLQQQLSRLSATATRAGSGAAAGRTSAMRGRKVAPKFRGPNGETWAGRGAQPRWLTALLKSGHKVEEFLIAKGASARGGAKRSKSRAK